MESRISMAASSGASRVTDDARRGLLGQGSILTVTSVATRTSPVQRGKWLLENVLGTPPNPPPAGVPPLKENAAGRERADGARKNGAAPGRIRRARGATRCSIRWDLRWIISMASGRGERWAKMARRSMHRRSGRWHEGQRSGGSSQRAAEPPERFRRAR